jgi:mannose-6-phosphate isomerase-like protein (cupin superfamily)
MKLLPCCVAIAVFVFAAGAQTTSRTDYHSSQDIQSTLASLIPASQAPGYASDKLFDAGTHSLALSVRTKSGGGEAHAHYDDIMIVVDGAATEITGGTVVDAQTGADGETRGSSVAGGHAQPIAKGDIIHIMAGTAHQMIVAPGGSIRYIVVKIKES